jgi:predicted small metal-binding protein
VKVTLSGPTNLGGKEAVMAKVVNCPCGTTVRGETDDELVSNVEAHVQSDHPEMVGKMSREDVLGMAEEA